MNGAATRLWYALYNVLLLAGTALALPYWLAVRFLRGRYKGQFRERMGRLPEAVRARFGERPALWVHAASAGETASAVPLVAALKEQWPDRPVLFTVTSRYGKRMAEQRLEGVADAICFSPLDLPAFDRRFLDAIRPFAYVMVETDLWPNLLRLARRRGVPCFLASGYASRRSFPRPFWRAVFAFVDRFYMQTDVDARNIVARGAPSDRVRIGGNMKFDGSGRALSGDERAALRRDFGFPADAPVFVAGSTLPADEGPVLDAIAALRGEGHPLHAIVAPRRLDRVPEVMRGLAARGIGAARRSDRDAAPAVVLDTMGELAGTYGVAAAAYIGGGFTPDVGLHNLIEPLVGGAPVLFGPHRGKAARVAHEILRLGAGVEVADGAALLDGVRRVLTDRAEAGRLAEAGRAVLEENCGAARRQAHWIREALA